jgi:hypothetical protein
MSQRGMGHVGEVRFGVVGGQWLLGGEARKSEVANILHEALAPLFRSAQSGERRDERRCPSSGMRGGDHSGVSTILLYHEWKGLYC